MNAKMSEVRRAFEDAGFTDVKTLLASGNVVFTANSARPIAVPDARLLFDLAKRVAELQELGLAEPNRVRTVTHAPETSHEAAASMRARAGSDAHPVFQTIWLAWKRESVGLTTDQIEARLNRTHQSISARVNQLKNEGWIIDSGYRLRTRSGRKAIVWTPTNVGKGVYL